MSRRWGQVAAGTVAVAMAVGCAPKAVEDPVSTPAPVTNFETITGSIVVGEPESAPEPTAVPELPLVVDGGGAAPLRGQAVIADVILGADGRSVEYRLAGDGALAYVVRYVDQAVRHRTSEPMAIPGRSILQIDFSGIAVASEDADGAYEGPECSRGSEGAAIGSVDFLAAPDGISQSFLGVAAERPGFTVTSTDEPAAVIVSVSP